jgi:hypothetical protein
MPSTMASALFPDKVEAIAEIRALLAPHAAQLINMKFLSDDMIWDKLMAAESEAERVLKVFFSAVEVRPVTTQEEPLQPSGVGPDGMDTALPSGRWA